MAISLTELIGRYEVLSSPLVYDILEHMGYADQALDSDISALDPDAVVAGPAFTFDGETYRDGLPETIPFNRVFRHITPHSVIVSATNGHSVAGPWGENTSIAAQVQGARGIVLDGGTRDARAMVKMGFPAFCRFVTPVMAPGRYQLTGYQVPVDIAGQIGSTVKVNPSDFVMADRDGIVIVPQAIVEPVLLAAERLEEIEVVLRAELLAGEDREVVYERHPKFDHVMKIEESSP